METNIDNQPKSLSDTPLKFNIMFYLVNAINAAQVDISQHFLLTAVLPS
jgi:hypothetical protein